MKRIDLTRLQPKFQKLVESYMKDKGITQTELASQLGMQRSHLNALLSRNRQAQRKLTAYYLFHFIRRGIMGVSEIYNGDAKESREIDFWETASEAENIALLQKIARLRKKGVDVDKVLDAINGDQS